MSKNAVSYSSPSIDEIAAGAEAVIGAEISADAADHHRGSRPAAFSTCAIIEVEVVLPWVPADHQRALMLRKKCHSASGIERYGIAALEQRFGLGIVARDNVADHHQIGRGIQIGAARSRFGLRPATAEQRRGRLVELAVGAADAIAARFEHPGQRRHRGAADTR